MRICILDDERISRSVIRAVLTRADEYDVDCFGDAVSALARCRETVYDLVLVDYRMADMDGLTCVSHLRALPDYQFVPIIMLTADHDRDLRLAAVRAGATDFLNKPFDPEELRVRTHNLLSLRQAQLSLMDRASHLAAEVQQATRKLVAREEELIWRLARAIERRDGSTHQHITRVAAVSDILARALGQSPTFCRTIYLAAPLHDTGKIGISETLLNKPGALKPDERAEIQRHTTIGADILQDGESDLIRMAHEIALFHHEKWDGSGYPQGRAGADIPLAARIVAVADVFDALCSARPYKAEWSFDTAYAEILRQSARHFDPQCVAAFTASIDQIAKLYPPTATADVA